MNGERSHHAHRYSSVMPAIRAIRSNSAGQTYRNGAVNSLRLPSGRLCNKSSNGESLQTGMELVRSSDSEVAHLDDGLEYREQLLRWSWPWRIQGVSATSSVNFSNGVI